MNLVSWRIIEVVWLLGNLIFNTDRSLECEMLVYREQTSKVTNKVLLGRFETFLSLFKKSVVSWIKLFTSWAYSYGFKWNSTYCEIFSVRVSLLETIGRPGLLGLCILRRRQDFPGCRSCGINFNI